MPKPCHVSNTFAKFVDYVTHCINYFDRELTCVVGSSLAKGVLIPIDFDKDVDEHMRVIASCANLRARNYKIPEADFHTARYIFLHWFMQVLITQRNVYFFQKQTKRQ